MTTITREQSELKSFITGFLSDPAHDNQSSNSLTAEVFRIALASLEAVPDDVTGPLEYAYKELTTVFMRNHITAFERYGIYPDGSAGIQAMRIALDGMERRAAMLQGADGNSPVIPDGWVACSERMPGSQEWVIVFAKWANQQVLCWDDVANRWTDFEDQSYFHDMFSHWMPLPPAPQQEVK